MQTKELKIYKVTQKGSRLIIEKCEDGYGVEEETAMVAEPIRRYRGRRYTP